MRKRPIEILIIFVISLVMSACNSSNSGVSVTGVITGTEVRSLTLFELSVHDSKELGTVQLRSKGNFKFDFEAEEVGFYYISADNYDYIVLIAAPGEDISVNAEGWSISQTYSVSGSKESALLQAYRKGYYENLNGLAEANRTLIQSRGEDNYPEIHAAMTERMEQLFLQQKEIATNFIKNNPGSLASLIVINDKFGQTHLFTDEEDMSLLELLDEGLMKAYPGNSHTLEHHQRVIKAAQNSEMAAALTPGNEAPDFCLNTAENKKLCLTDFEGKVVLVDFWASWCAPCRKANPKIKVLYEKYQSQGFEILGVSLDDSMEKWQAAVKEDGITWSQVSDLKGPQSPVARLYNISKIPTTMLLDREGRIIAFDLSYEALESQIKAHL
jgi:peroxiredoxin